MLKIEPTGEVLGATVMGVDTARPLDRETFSAVLKALGTYGVLRFPGQNLDGPALRAFSQPFGEIQASINGVPTVENCPEVGILSNIVENGRAIGMPDAGQTWHTDMTYRSVVGFINVLYGVKVPRRNGQVLGATEFANMYLAYKGLPEEFKTRFKDATVLHDLGKYWNYMREVKGSKRPPYTEEQRRKRPPVSHPLFLTHPITGKKVLYANPGYSVRIEGIPEAESRDVLEYLYEHQTQPRYCYSFRWTERDLLVWDHIGTIHNAVADYGPDEHRLMLRCQVMADKIFDRNFITDALLQRTV